MKFWTEDFERDFKSWWTFIKNKDTIFFEGYLQLFNVLNFLLKWKTF